MKQEVPVEFHPPRTCADGEHEVEAHFCDHKSEWQVELASAKEMVAEACQIAQNVMAEMP